MLSLWRLGLAMGAWVSGGISGGHLNPAVSPFPLVADFPFYPGR